MEDIEGLVREYVGHRYPRPPHYYTYTDPRNWKRRAHLRFIRQQRAANNAAIAKRYAMLPARAAGLAVDVGIGNYLTRNQRQKYFLGNNYNMYGLTNYRSRMPPAKKSKPKSKATNRKNVKNIPKAKPKTLQRQINQIAKQVNLLTSKHTHRYAESGYAGANDGECDHVEWAPVSPTNLENYTNNLRFYDSTGNALDTADPTTLTASHDIKFKNIHSRITVRNNNSVPADIKIYCCKVKSDTSNGVLATYTAALADQCVTAGADTESPLMYLTDMERVREEFDIDCVKDITLPHGKQVTASHNTGEFNYDPSHIDTETTAYQKAFKAFLWVVRVQGQLGHDSVQFTTELGLGKTTVDVMVENKAEIIYNSGGVALNDYSFNDQRDTSFSNSHILGVINSPDNIGESLT